MAHKISVLEPDGSVFSTGVKKCVARRMVKRMLAVWVGQFAIRRLTDKEASRRRTDREEIDRKEQSLTHYIPDKMPPAEVENCHFTGGSSDPDSTIPRTRWSNWAKEASDFAAAQRAAWTW